MTDLYDDEFLENSDDDITLEQLEAAAERFDARQKKAAAPPRGAARYPMLQTLFRSFVEPGDQVLSDFTDHVLGALTDIFGTETAKGGDFARARQAEVADGTKKDDTHRYSHDQTLRAHILNGMLPALRIARQLKNWGALKMRRWNEQTERLFIAGYVLHDYTKIDSVKDAFKDAGFGTFTTPNEAKLPLIEQQILEWCQKLGLDTFLQDMGGAKVVLHDLIYVAQNTQRMKETLRLPVLLPNKATSSDVYLLAADVSWLADLIAYIARTPRDLVANASINNALDELVFDRNAPQMRMARLTYHHVAENRGVLLNFIHDAVQHAMIADTDLRVPLLFAPSGIVYLEQHDAPPPPEPDALIAQIVEDIRQKAGQALIVKGKGAKVSKDGLRIDDSYNDYLDLRQFIAKSHRLTLLVRSNAPQYMEKLQTLRFPHTDELPTYGRDKTDTRLRQMAEWASLVEIQVETRYPEFQNDFIQQVLEHWGITDLSDLFNDVRNHKPEREGTGIRYYWFWAAAHSLARLPLNPDQVAASLETLSGALAAALPEELPDSAHIDDTKWNDLADYLARVLSIGGAKSGTTRSNDEFNRYINAKRPRAGEMNCAMCGDAYTVTQPKETVIAFQPGVYTSRVKMNANSNARSLCSICSLEQLLRQLFVENNDSGSTAEGQRVRYLSFYPSYFFTPETLRVIMRMYNSLQTTRLSDVDLNRLLREADLESNDVRLWTHLTPFLLTAPGETPSKRILRYGEEVGGTFFMIGLRNFDPKTDVETWIMPVFLALILSINLDLKVVISEGSVPLITESDEFQEMIWLDGVHSAIRAVLDIGRKQPADRLHVDEMLSALTCLTVAYLIHLDSEYAPPDENWRRFPPIAHSLAESPLYVFHYLLKQERDDPERKPLSQERVERYLAYSRILSPHTEDSKMTIANKLVDSYRGFYRADNFKNSNSILRPINVVADALLTASATPDYRDPEMLTQIANGELYKFMDRVSKGLADGRFPKGISPEARAASMDEFCRLFVDELFVKTFNSDAAALRGKPINLLKNACEVLYRKAQYKEWAERGRDAEDTEAEPDVENETL